MFCSAVHGNFNARFNRGFINFFLRFFDIFGALAFFQRNDFFQLREYVGIGKFQA